MNPLTGRLAVLRRRLRSVTLVRGLSLAVVCLLGGLLVAGGLDWLLHLPSVLRALLLVGMIGGTVAVGYHFLAPLWTHTDDLSLALRVEEEYPLLNDALASTVQFLQQPEGTTASGSPALRREAVNRALRLAQGCDFSKVIDRRGYRLGGAAALTVIVLCAAAGYFFPETFTAATLRLLHPFGEHAWPTQTRLELEFPRRIATGQLFEIKGQVSRVVPENAVVEFDGLRSTRETRLYKIERSADGKAGTFVAKVETTDQYRSFRFRVRVNDASEPKREDRWHTVEVGTPPVLVAWNGLPTPQVTLHYPAYTDLPSPEKLSPGTGYAPAVAGTKAVLIAATDRPIATAWIEYRPGQRELLGMQLSQLGVLGHTLALENVSLLAGLQYALERIPATLHEGGQVFSVDFQPWVTGTYVLHIEDADGLAKDYEFPLEVLPDPRPEVTIQQPASNRSLLANAALSLRITAADEMYAIRSAYLEYRRKDTDGRWLDVHSHRLPLFDGPALERLSAGMLVGLASVPVPLPPPVKWRPRGLLLERRWSLEGLVQEGDILVIQACADDFNDVDPFRTPGRSHEIEIRIVSPSQFDALLDGEQKKLQQALLRLREWQEQALKNVVAAEEQAKATGKLKEADLQKLREAEQLQKQIQARVGSKEEEGLRAELQRLQQMMKDNKIHSSGAKDRIDAIKHELDRLAREQLQRITPRLTETRQKLDSQESKQPDGKTSSDLGQAREDQQEVQKTLEELLEYLARWADQQQIRGEARAILEEQKQLQNKTGKLDDPFQPQDREWEAALNRLAAAQRELGRKTQRLLDKMKRVAQEKALKDPDAANMLDRAARIGEDEMLPASMKDIADVQLPRKQVNKTQKQQGTIVDALGKMVKALQENRTEEVERLQKKQAEIGQELDQLADALEKLQKKVQEASKIADPEQRKEALQKLAEEQRKLEEQAREEARQLARLRANEASQQMRQAAEKMAQAAKQLDTGEDPGEAQQEAQEKLEQAQAQLDLAQQRAEEELARERLAKIADQIKGVKDRQDAAIAESERLHKAMLQTGWQRPLASSLYLHGVSQQGLGKEAAQLVDRIKEAKVFAAILGKAAKNMEEAGKSILARKEKIVEVGRLELFPLADEELKDEQQMQEQILQLQTRAQRRLEHLLAALKGELDAPPRQPESAQKKDENEKQPEGQPKGGLQAQDGIPAVAQLKALRDEQADVNERTRAFAEAHPDVNNLTEREMVELRDIQADQETLFELFRQIVTAANQDLNEGKEP